MTEVSKITPPQISRKRNEGGIQSLILGSSKNILDKPKYAKINTSKNEITTKIRKKRNVNIKNSFTIGNYEIQK